MRAKWLGGQTKMQTLQEVRKELDEQIEKLRTLQRDKMMAPAERKEAIQKHIDTVSLDIRRLDTVGQGLINNRSTP